MFTPSQDLRVLVVEDEAIVARDISQQLVELGYQPIGMANTAEQAIEKASELLPNMILMDIQLGGDIDGIAAAEKIRSLHDIPIIFITAYSADEILNRAKLTEPFGYMLKPFSERELRTTLAMAFYKHQAEAKLRATSRQLKALSRRVLEVQEMERRRVAVELHDELGQTLTAVKINLQLSERLKGEALAALNAENIRFVEDALQQVRRLAITLRPSMLDDLGLAPALKWLAEQSATRAGFSVSFHHVRAQARLASDIETACFRIVQEALTNITRHAQATRVEISLRRDGDDMVLCVQDDGVGFDMEAIRQRALQGTSLGVLGMQERANLIGGELKILSASGKGSTVQLTCPWRAQVEAI